MAKKTKSPDNTVLDTVLHLNPDQITADDNIRLSLREGDVERMMESITDRGGVQEPVSIEVVDGAYRLLKGFIRHAAVSRLNAKGAGLTLPALVRPTVDPVERLKLQITENVARAALSPMDEAVSIKRLVDADVPKVDIRRMFARGGSSKGAKVSPMSNAWVNLTLAMLDLPQDIQAKIHDGRISGTAGQELTKVPAERRAAVLARAEAEVAAQLKREETEEDRFLKAQAAEEKRNQQFQEAEGAVAAAKEQQAKAEALAQEKLTAYRQVQAEEYDPTNAEAKKAYGEKLASHETDVKAAQGLVKKAKNAVAKALKSQATAEELREKLKQARESAPPVASVGPTAVKKAAAADAKTPAGKEAGAAPKLSASQIRDAVKEIREETPNPIVADVMKIITACFDGTETPKQTRIALEKRLKVAVKK